MKNYRYDIRVFIFNGFTTISLLLYNINKKEDDDYLELEDT
jgi:hypothetical protein